MLNNIYNILNDPYTSAKNGVYDTYSYVTSGTSTAFTYIRDNARLCTEGIIKSSVDSIRPEKNSTYDIINTAQDKLPEAITDALLLDLVIHGSLIATGFAALSVWGVASIVTGATISYTIRKTITEYNKGDTANEYMAKLSGGIVGGAIKYSITSGFTQQNILIGSINNLLYEMMAKQIVENIENQNILVVGLIFYQIESTDVLIDTIIKSPHWINTIIKLRYNDDPYSVLLFWIDSDVLLKTITATTIASLTLTGSIWMFYFSTSNLPEYSSQSEKVDDLPTSSQGQNVEHTVLDNEALHDEL